MRKGISESEHNNSMTDIMSKEQRSYRMSLVRCRDTAFERSFLRILSAELYPLGYRYRKHCRAVTGTPDVVFHRYRTAIFLDSDFWHGRNYDPRSSRMSPFWRSKIERNIARDIQVNRTLRRDGWTVLRFGEKDLKRRPFLAVRKIQAAIAKRTLSD